MSSVVETPVAALADPGDLTEDDLRRMYRTMVTGRLLAERFWILSRQGKTHFVITSQGHEAAQVGSAMAM
jgi:2-oxoisovalerate dehydrogenase E1 component alpha subunit